VSFNESLGILTSQFEKFISTKTVIGEPFVLGNVTLIPVITATAGIGGGGGEGTTGKETSSNSGTGLGIGGGFRVSPIAVVVIKGDEVSMLPVGKKSGLLDKLFESLPDLAAKMGSHRKAKHGEEHACEDCEEE
jgi:uncharacterized spore protein YtfJ